LNNYFVTLKINHYQYIQKGYIMNQKWTTGEIVGIFVVAIALIVFVATIAAPENNCNNNIAKAAPSLAKSPVENFDNYSGTVEPSLLPGRARFDQAADSSSITLYEVQRVKMIPDIYDSSRTTVCIWYKTHFNHRSNRADSSERVYQTPWFNVASNCVVLWEERSPKFAQWAEIKRMNGRSILELHLSPEGAKEM